MYWPFKRERPAEETPVSPETRELADKHRRLEDRIDALGVETRAVAREAQYVRSQNNFGPALIAVWSTPRRPL